MTERMPGNGHPDAVGIRVLLSVGLGTCMSALDASVANTVLPVVQTEYHVPAGPILAGVAGGKEARMIPPERVFRAIHIGFLAAGVTAFAGAILAAARSEGQPP